MQKSKTKNIKTKISGGYLLIEAIIGINVAIIGILGILTLLSRSTSLNRVVSDQYVGNYLAAEGIEIIKNLIDANIIQGKPWNEGFFTGSVEVDYLSRDWRFDENRPLLFDPATNRYSYQSGELSPFTRTIYIQLIGSEEMKVNSVVRWKSRGGGQFETNLEDHFFNWRP